MKRTESPTGKWGKKGWEEHSNRGDKAQIVTKDVGINMLEI